jgi:hypothetical protein
VRRKVERDREKEREIKEKEFSLLLQQLACRLFSKAFVWE